MGSRRSERADGAAAASWAARVDASPPSAAAAGGGAAASRRPAARQPACCVAAWRCAGGASSAGALSRGAPASSERAALSERAHPRGLEPWRSSSPPPPARPARRLSARAAQVRRRARRGVASPATKPCSVIRGVLRPSDTPRGGTRLQAQRHGDAEALEARLLEHPLLQAVVQRPGGKLRGDVEHERAAQPGARRGGRHADAALLRGCHGSAAGRGTRVEAGPSCERLFKGQGRGAARRPFPAALRARRGASARHGAGGSRGGSWC